MRTAGVTFPKATKVLSSATIIPPFIIPMKAMNKPIPPLTASFIFFGIALATASRILNNDSIIKYQILENKRRPVFPLFSVKGD